MSDWNEVKEYEEDGVIITHEKNTDHGTYKIYRHKDTWYGDAGWYVVLLVVVTVCCLAFGGWVAQDCAGGKCRPPGIGTPTPTMYYIQPPEWFPKP